MGLIEKFQTLIIMGAVAIGLAVGQLPFAAEYAEYTIVPFLLLMLYGLFLTIPLRQLREAFKNIRFLGASTLINFIWTPLLAWGLGAVFLSDHPALWIGFIMLMVTPCTDWYLVFTSIAKGNVPLGASVLPINLILQVLLLPLYLLLFSGTIESISMATLIESVLLVLVVPFTLNASHPFHSENQERGAGAQGDAVLRQGTDCLSESCHCCDVCVSRVILIE